MSNYLMNIDTEQAYVFTNKDGVATGTFSLQAIWLHVEGDTCEVRFEWFAREVFKNGIVINLPEVRGQVAAHLCETGFTLPLDTRGGVACISAELEAQVTDKGCIARAALMEFARAVEWSWSVRTFIANNCPR